MTVHYHGGPIWGDKETTVKEAMNALWFNGGALVSYARPDQLKAIVNIPCSLILDNGAFSFWRSAAKKKEVLDWDKHWEGYYDNMVAPWYSRIDFFFIPDVIEGTEEDNDALIEKTPSWLMEKAVPVWHTDESLARLMRLCRRFDRVAIGCTGPHRHIRSAAWRIRMEQVFTAVYEWRQYPVKLHGLRMLDGRVLSEFPFATADSASVAVNAPKTEKIYPDIKGRLARIAVIRACKEMVQPISVEDWLKKR